MAENEEIIDRISHLPDELRNEIVSRVPFQEATRMSCLSKRWRNVSRSLTNLRFDQSTLQRKLRRVQISFNDFVYQTLELHDGLYIEKFNLIVDIRNVSLIDIDAWVSFAVGHNVKEFYMSLMMKETWKLSCSLLTSETLRVMILHNMIVSLPETIGFPKLKTLKLGVVDFIDENSANHLLSRCPLLEELSLSSCHQGRVKTLRISGCNLKSITLWNSHRPDIEISAPNLCEIVNFGELPKMSVETLSSLHTVKHQDFPSHAMIIRPRGVRYRLASDIMMGLHSVYKMTLRGLFIEYLTWGPASLALQPTSCCRLEHLHLDMYPSKNQVQVLIFLLRRCSNLKCLSVSYENRRASKTTGNMDDSWQLQKMSSKEGLLKSLKIINIGLLVGSNIELDLVKVLLENADSLERMDVTYCRRNTKDVLSMMSTMEKISEFNKASPDVVISLDYLP